MDLSLTLAQHGKQELHLANPVMTASGTFSNGLEMAKRFDIERLGAIVSKGTTLRPRKGNPPPRTVETASGMLNSIGLQNPGLESFVGDKWPYLALLDTRVIVNIAAPTADLHGEMAARLEDVEGIAGIEVNISSPNMKGKLSPPARLCAVSARWTTCSANSADWWP